MKSIESQNPLPIIYGCFPGDTALHILQYITTVTVQAFNGLEQGMVGEDIFAR